jgi:predicted Fe-S protein YdhL (DUF1289 family)
MIMTNFDEQLEDIEHQLRLICIDRGISRSELYTFNKFTDGERFVIMRLLETKAKVVREELLHMHQKFNNVIYLSTYRKK